MDSSDPFGPSEGLFTREFYGNCYNALKDDGEEGVYVFGNVNKEVSHLAIGTGAGTDIFEMLEFNPDVVIVADYFNDKLPDLDVEYLEEGYRISYFK